MVHRILKMSLFVFIVMILGLYSTKAEVGPDVSTDTLDRERRAEETSGCATPPRYTDCRKVGKAMGLAYQDGKNTLRTLSGREFCAECTKGTRTTIQKRTSGKVSFNRNWFAYKHGFGDIDGDHWLGNDLIYEITNSDIYTLIITLETWDGNTFSRQYQNFYIENEAANYRLHFGDSVGSLPDSLSYHKGMNFSTPDRDNDNIADESYKCAKFGGFWYKSCSKADLNGLYWPGGNATLQDGRYSGIEWEDVDPKYPNNFYSFKSSQMQLMPLFL